MPRASPVKREPWASQAELDRSVSRVRRVRRATPDWSLDKRVQQAPRARWVKPGERVRQVLQARRDRLVRPEPQGKRVEQVRLASRVSQEPRAKQDRLAQRELGDRPVEQVAREGQVRRVLPALLERPVRLAQQEPLGRPAQRVRPASLGPRGPLDQQDLSVRRVLPDPPGLRAKQVERAALEQLVSPGLPERLALRVQPEQSEPRVLLA